MPGLVALLLFAPARAARWNWSGTITLDNHSLLGDVDAVDPASVKTGSVVEGSVKTTVDVNDQLSISSRVCTSCHGIAVGQASAEIAFHPQLNLEAGRINVPFGDFTLRHDPANDAFLSKPLPYAMGHMLRFQRSEFNLGVLPMPYVDQGASLSGDVWIRDALQVWYAVYAVNGFRSESPRDFNFKSQIDGFEDNNNSPSWGTRLSLAQGEVAFGGSYLRGTYDVDSEYFYDVWGFDGSARVLGVQLRAEYLVRGTEVLDDETTRVLRKKGFFAQAEVPVRRQVDLVARVDGLLRQGSILGTDNDTSSAIVRGTVGWNWKPTIDYAFRVQYEHWRFTDFPDADGLHVGAVVSY